MVEDGSRVSPSLAGRVELPFLSGWWERFWVWKDGRSLVLDGRCLCGLLDIPIIQHS